MPHLPNWKEFYQQPRRRVEFHVNYDPIISMKKETRSEPIDSHSCWKWVEIGSTFSLMSIESVN